MWHNLNIYASLVACRKSGSLSTWVPLWPALAWEARAMRVQVMGVRG
jgi:hypothetical protein